MIAKNFCPIMIILHKPLPLVANYLNRPPPVVHRVNFPHDKICAKTLLQLKITAQIIFHANSLTSQSILLHSIFLFKDHRTRQILSSCEDPRTRKILSLCEDPARDRFNEIFTHFVSHYQLLHSIFVMKISSHTSVIIIAHPRTLSAKYFTVPVQ